MLVLLPFLVLVVPHINVVPMWDGAIYAEVVLKAASEKLNIWGLNYAGHPGIGSLLIPALLVNLTRGQLWALHLGNVVLGSLAIISFLSIVDLIFAEVSRLERLLIALVFSALPVVAANLLHTNLDFGTMVFFILFLSALLRQHFFIATIPGALLLLAKEAGIVVWITTIISYLVAVILRREGSLAEKMRKIIRMSPALLSVAALVAYLIVRIRQSEGLVWAPVAGQEQGVLQQMASFSLLDPVFHAYLAAIFSMNCMWIPASFIAIAALVWAFRSLVNSKSNEFAMRRELIAILLCTLVIVLTRFKTFVNVRYFLPIFPVLILAFAHALQGLVRPYRVRLLILGVTASLFFLSGLRTVDPVSRRIFGTFPFGSHSMLNVTSITKECCGLGRDQLVYNLEFMRLDELINKALLDLRPSDSQPIVVADAANWFLVNWTTSTEPPRRALPGRGARPTPVLSARQVVSSPTPPQKVSWLDMPNAVGSAELELLKTRYSIIEEKRYERAGYSLSGLLMALK